MGSEQYAVDYEQVRRTGTRIGQSAGDIRTALEAFNGELAGFGQPWGNDDIGSLIGMCYGAMYDIFMECCNENLEALNGQVEGVTVMAGNYREAEDVSGVEVNRVRDILG